MPLRFDHLAEDHYPEVHQTMMEAFADYALDMSYMTPEVTRNRALKNGIDMTASVGAFEDDKMVGLTLVGLDQWKGTNGAYDIATGIIPSHRGQGLAGRMFEFILPGLRERGVETFVLEVLQENTAAIHAYEKQGFRAVREFDCYTLDLERFLSRGVSPSGSKICTPDRSIEIREMDRSFLGLVEDALDWPPSWENSFNGIRRIPDEVLVLGAYSGKKPAGVAVWYPTLNWLMTLAVRPQFRGRGLASALLCEVANRTRTHVKILKVNNVQRNDAVMTAFMTARGFECYTQQYEMEKAL